MNISNLPAIDLPVSNAQTARSIVPGDTYRVKNIWKTLQGEGFFAGRPAVFCRLVGCNMWSGYEEDRARDAERHGADCPQWCFSPETPVLMADYTTKAIGQVRVGERVMATYRENRCVKLHPTTVRNKVRRTAPLALIHFDNGTLTGTSDHKILTRGENSRERIAFREASGAEGRKTYSLLGSSRSPKATRGAEFWRGWLSGVAFGDGCFWTLKKTDERRAVPYDRSSSWVEKTLEYRRFRLAMHDGEVLDAFRRKAVAQGFDGWHEGIHEGTGHSDYVMRALYMTQSETAEAFEKYLLPDLGAPKDFQCGFLAGFIDAEGSIGRRTLVIHQSREANPGLCRIVDHYLQSIGVSFYAKGNCWEIYGQDSFRLLATCPPILTRKTRSFDGRSLGECYGSLDAVEETGIEGAVVDLTTDAGNYIAGGHVVKNCDTDFRKEDSRDLTAEALAREMRAVGDGIDFCVLTGGEPLLQADAPLVRALHDESFQVAVETNGTIALADAFGTGADDELHAPDWIVCSPKLEEERLELERFDELKLVVPDYRPSAYASFAERARTHEIEEHRVPLLWLQPEDGPRLEKAKREAVELALSNPAWRVSVQGHKVLDVE